MLKKNITFETFDGETVTEEHHFHLSKADLVELEVSHKGGLSSWITSIIESEDGKSIMEEFKKLLLMSYGKKSEDGRRFIKNEELREDFISSPAYEALFFELVTDAEKAAAFVNGIVPKGLDEEVARMKSTSASAETDRVNRPGLNPDRSKIEPATMEGPRPVPSTTPDQDEVAALDKARNVFEENPTRVLTLAEVREMDADELKSGLATGRYTLPQ